MSEVLTTQLSTSSEFLKEETSVYKTYNRFFRSISKDDPEDEEGSNDSQCDSRRGSIFSYISNSFSFSDEVRDAVNLKDVICKKNKQIFNPLTV